MVIVGGSAGSFTLTEMTAEKFYEAGLPSELICQTICKRLTEHRFPYPFEHCNYEAASHYLLPVKSLSAKLFRVERKHSEDCDVSRWAAWEDTLHFMQEKWQ